MILSHEDLIHLASAPQTLGDLLTTLVVPEDFEFDGLVFAPGSRWIAGAPGATASARYGDVPMQGYVDPTRTVVLTVVDDGGEIRLHAEGDGWSIESDGFCGTWTATGENTGSRDAGGGRPLVSMDFESIGLNGLPADVAMVFHTSMRDAGIVAPDHPTIPPRAFEVRSAQEAAAILRMELEAGGDLPGSTLAANGEPSASHPWLEDGYDWATQLGTAPNSAVSRIHVLSHHAGVDVDDGVRLSHEPAAALLSLIEAKLGIAASADRPAGLRIHDAEQAVFGTVPDAAGDRLVETLLSLHGFQHVENDEPHEDHWLAGTLASGIDLLVEKEGDGWSISRTSFPDEPPSGEWKDMASGLPWHHAAVRIHLAASNPSIANPWDLRERMRSLAEAVGDVRSLWDDTATAHAFANAQRVLLLAVGDAPLPEQIRIAETTAYGRSLGPKA